MMHNPLHRWFRSAVAAALVAACVIGFGLYQSQQACAVRFATSRDLDTTLAIGMWVIVVLLMTLALWLALVWVLVQVWEYRMLKMSLYIVELELDADSGPARQSTAQRDE